MSDHLLTMFDPGRLYRYCELAAVMGVKSRYIAKIVTRQGIPVFKPTRTPFIAGQAWIDFLRSRWVQNDAARMRDLGRRIAEEAGNV